MANARDQEQDPSKRGLTGSYHQRTYGTVKEDFSHSLNPKRDAKVLMHEVKLTDTLQGIALKYDVAVSLEGVLFLVQFPRECCCPDSLLQDCD